MKGLLLLVLWVGAVSAQMPRQVGLGEGAGYRRRARGAADH